MPSKTTAVAVAAASAFLAGCAAVGVPAPPMPARDDGPGQVAYVALTPAQTVESGACTDSTGSMGAGGDGARLLADLVAGWATEPAGPAELIGGAAPRPGLHLHVRGVVDTSNSTATPYVEVRVQPVPGLAARPAVTDPAFLVDDPIWWQWRDDVVAAARQAAREAGDGAAALRAAPVDRARHSDVWGCVAALAQIVRPPALLVVVSDLLQNVPVSFAGDLTRARLLVVQECHADAGSCAAVRETWRRDLAARGLPDGAVEFVRPEVADAALARFLGSVTP